jgi:two-component system chemotaxis sensor kinase CheA
MEEILDSLRYKYSEEGKRLVLQARSLLSLYEANSAFEMQFEELFRIMHTLKGNSAMFQQPEVEAISKKLESVYDLLKNEKLTISEEIIDISLIGLSQIEILLENAGELSGSQWKSQSLIIAKLDAMLKSSTTENRPSKVVERGHSSTSKNSTFSFFKSKKIFAISQIF